MPHGTSIRRTVCHRFAIASRCASLSLLASLLLATTAAGQIVLSGLTLSFTNVGGTDPLLRANQDRIALSVLLTRGNSGGVFNAVLEEVFELQDPTVLSPLLTEWATEFNNPEATIAATYWDALEFDTWINAYGGLPGAGPATVGTPAVLHIIPEDIYLDILFTSWPAGGSGGFSYQRSNTPDGDFNGNGVVDAADYTVWRDTVGLSAAAPGDGADGDLSGMIDQGDYEFWIEVFGEVINTVDLDLGLGATADLPSSAATVPEPATLWLLCAAALAMGLAARLRA